MQTHYDTNDSMSTTSLVPRLKAGYKAKIKSTTRVPTVKSSTIDLQPGH
jgi:hypothetical protein